MGGIPERFAATGAESAIAITRAVTLQRIGVRLAFPGRLDAARLARAVRLSLDAEPVLGCEFRTDERRAYWARLGELDAAPVFSMLETTDPDGEMVAFQAAEVPDAGPQARVVLLRAPEADHLGIKLSHVVADGYAAKAYAYLLADTYSRLEEDASYVPEPNLSPRASGREVWAQLTREQRRDARRAKSWAKPTWVVPARGSSGEGLTYRAATLPPDRFVAVKAYGKQRGSTVNDMLLTAVLRACIRSFDPPAGVPLSLMCTADLRRYLPDRERLPIGTVSISGSLDIERVDGESFDETLGRVHERMAAWAKTCYGAGPLASAEKMAGLGYGLTKALLGLAFESGGSSGEERKTYPWFTNIGILDEGRLSFGGVVPVSGHMYGPSARGASIVPVISTLGDRLTICMGFPAPDMDAEVVERVLAQTMTELAEAVGEAAA